MPTYSQLPVQVPVPVLGPMPMPVQVPMPVLGPMPVPGPVPVKAYLHHLGGRPSGNLIETTCAPLRPFARIKLQMKGSF